MPWKPRIRPPMVKCGSCPKSYRLGERHTCITRLDRKARRPRKAKLTGPQLTLWTCPDCGKPAGLRHTCRKRSDFRKRKRDAEAQRKKEEQAARRKAAAASRARSRHDPDECTDEDCQAYGCVQFRRGFELGQDVGYGTGHAEGHAEGYELGYREGYAAGRSESD